MRSRLASFFVAATAAAFVPALGCSSPPPGAPPPVSSAPAPNSRDALVGSWQHDLPNGEHYTMTLFASGVFGFIHHGELPVSYAYGRWSFDNGTLVLDVAGVELGDETFPLPARMAVTRDGMALTLGDRDTRTRWSSHDQFGEARPGADERRARDERDWASRIERAKSSPE